jgi:putative membrane protein
VSDVPPAAPHPAPADAPAGAPRAADGAWHRVHPLTPAVKSWQALVVVLFFLAQDFGQQAFRGGFGDGDGGDDGDGGPGRLPDLGPDVLFGGTAVIVLLVAAVIGFAFLSWRMTRFRLTGEALEMHQGVLFRQQRSARLDRLQAVDVVQPLVARVFGLARLNLEVAGAGDSKIELAYLTVEQARSLRGHLLARAAGLAYESEEAPEAPEHSVFELPLERLFGSLLLSGAFVTAVLGVVALVVVTVVTGSPGPALGGALPFVLGVGGVLWGRFSGGFGFRVATSPDGVRLRHGLLEQRTQTVPPGRVQAVRLVQPLLWRHVDWWKVRVNVAGYGTGGDENAGESSTTLLPVASRDEALLVLAMVVPQLGVTPPEQPRALVEVAMSGSGPEGGFTTCPESARWLDPLAWRRNGYRATGEVLMVRRGRLERQVDVVPHARTQSLGVRQGPLERRLGLATFAVHSTPGPVVPVVAHLASAEAARLLAEQTERARTARRAGGPERWMRSPLLDAPPPSGPPVDLPVNPPAGPPVAPPAAPGPAGPPPGAAS